MNPRLVIFDCSMRSQAQSNRAYGYHYFESKFEMEVYIIHEGYECNMKINFQYENRGVRNIESTAEELLDDVFSGKYTNREYEIPQNKMRIPYHLEKYLHLNGVFFHMENFPDWFKEKFDQRFKQKRLSEWQLES